MPKIIEQKKKRQRESQMCITHIGREEELISGRDSELSFGCDWLKNSSTYNIQFNQHVSITKKKDRESLVQALLTYHVKKS